jgi:hypothetical protein
MKLKTVKQQLETAKQVLRFWDPIKVINHDNDTSSTDNKYDSYAPGLISILEKGVNAKGVCDHLVKLRLSSMCLGTESPTEQEHAIARWLVAWRDSGYSETPDLNSQ